MWGEKKEEVVNMPRVWVSILATYRTHHHHPQHTHLGNSTIKIKLHQITSNNKWQGFSGVNIFMKCFEI